MSTKEFKAELNGLGAKISASRIQKLTHLAIKLSLKYADQIVGIIAEYIQESSFSTRLGALSIEDQQLFTNQFANGTYSAAKLREKDPKWENVYYKLIPERLGPVINILFDCSSKDMERMKRIVGLWKENSKLLPQDFSDSVYASHFAEVGVERVESPFKINPTKEENAGTPTMEASSTAPKNEFSNNTGAVQNLSAVDPSAIAGLSALLNLPSFGSFPVPVLTTTVNGSLGLTGLATANASSSILDELSSLKGQNLSIGLPGATPANIAPLLESEKEQNKSNSGDMRQGHSRQNDFHDNRNDHSDSRHRQHHDLSSRHHYGDDSRQHNQSYGGYGGDPRQHQSYGDPRQQHQSYGDPRQQHQSSYGSDPRQQYRSYNDDPREQYGGDPRNQHQSRGYDSRHQHRDDSRRGDGYHPNSRSDFQERSSQRDRNHDADNSSRYPSNHSGNDESQQRSTPFKKVPAPQLAPGPDCAPSFVDPSVPNDHIKIISRTLFISGVPSSCNQSEFKEMMEQVGRVESLRITQKQQAFVKIATRMEAEAIKHAYQGFKSDQGGPLKIGWCCGYGPREGFDFQEGTTLYEISRIPEQEIPYIEQSPRGGGFVKGGMAMEEPNVPLDLTMAGRGSSGKRPNSAQHQDLPPRQRW